MPAAAPCLSTGRERLNLILQPRGRSRSRASTQVPVDPETFVALTDFAARIEAWTGHRVDHAALMSAALQQFMKRHRQWSNGPA